MRVQNNTVASYNHQNLTPNSPTPIAQFIRQALESSFDEDWILNPTGSEVPEEEESKLSLMGQSSFSF